MANRNKKGQFSKTIKYKRCEVCDALFPPYKKHSRFCTRKCFNTHRETQKNIKNEVQSIKRLGNKKVYHHTKRGYVTLNLNGKMYYHHRLIMERGMGRKLESTEQVHHKNGKKSDNRPENLEIISINEHARLHATKPYRKCTKCDNKHYAKNLCKKHYRKII